MTGCLCDEESAEIGQRTIQSRDDSTEMEEELMKLKGDRGRMTRGELEMSFPGGQQGLGLGGGRWLEQERFFCTVKKKIVWWPRKDFEMSDVLYNTLVAGESEAGSWPERRPILTSDCSRLPKIAAKSLAGEIRNQFFGEIFFQTRQVLKLNSRSR